MKPRFSLRTLFAMTTLIAALFGWRQHRHSNASEFAELLGAEKYQQAAEYMIVKPQDFRSFGHTEEKVMQAKVDSSSSWREWWFPSVILNVRWSRGVSGGEETLKFAHTWAGFAEPIVISQTQLPTFIYDVVPTAAR